jgi:Cdc6-like AAA superfamily ATPase
LPVDTVLWKHLSGGEAVSSSVAKKYLIKYFGEASNCVLSSSPALQSRPMTILLIDEIDYLKTRDESVMYNFCNWPLLVNSKLFVIGVANVMDLLEQQLTRNLSRNPAGKQLRLVFEPYNYSQLGDIIVDRLQEHVGILLTKETIELIARKAANAGGDVRRALRICQRLV